MGFPNSLIKIPQDRVETFEKFINLNDEKIESFIKALHTTKPSLSISLLSKQISDLTNLSYEDIEDMVTMFFELYVFQSVRTYPIEQIVDSICDYAKQSKNEKLIPKDNNWDRLKKNMLAVLNQDNTLSLSAKAIEIYSDYEKVFCNAKIYSDIRPVFSSDLEEKPIMVVIHNLKITYNENNEHKETFIALDSNDLKQLKNQIQRAEEKEESLIKILKSSGFNYFDWSAK